MSAILRGALWVNDLSRLGEPPESGGAYAIAEVQGGHLGAHLADAAGLAESEVRERFARGARAWACWHRPEADLAAWLWVSTGSAWAPPLHRELRFADDECYGWGAGVRSDHRGHRLFARLLRHVGAQMRREGYRYQWGGIEDRNAPSRRANIEAGFVPVLHVVRELGELRTVPVVYADPELVARARRMLGVPDPTSPLAHAAAKQGPAPLPGWPAP